MKSRFRWFEVTTLTPTGHAVTFTEYAKDEREALANFKSRGPRCKKAKVLRIAPEWTIDVQNSPMPDKQPVSGCAPA